MTDWTEVMPRWHCYERRYENGDMLIVSGDADRWSFSIEMPSGLGFMSIGNEGPSYPTRDEAMKAAEDFYGKWKDGSS